MTFPNLGPGATSPNPDSLSPNFDPIAEAVGRSEIDWRQAVRSLSALQPGTVITDLQSPEEVDIFAYNIGAYLMRGRRDGVLRETPDTIKRDTKYQVGLIQFRSWYGSAKPPSVAIRPKHFLGTFKNLQAVMLEDTYTVPELPEKNFLLSGEMHTSGAGLRGSFAKCCSIQTLKDGYPGHYTPRLVNTKYTDVLGQSPEAIAEKITIESRQVSRELVIAGLRHVLSGGLPSLGKRR